MRSDRYLELSLSYFYDRRFDRLKTALPGLPHSWPIRPAGAAAPFLSSFFDTGRCIPCGTIAPN